MATRPSRATYAREWRVGTRQKRRLNSIASCYVSTKYPDIWKEICQFYTDLNGKYPRKHDLTKTKEFRKWKSEAGRNEMSIETTPLETQIPECGSAMPEHETNGGPERESAMPEHETNGGPERESAMPEHETNGGPERESAMPEHETNGGPERESAMPEHETNGGPERETAMSEHETNGGPERESAMPEHETNGGPERESAMPEHETNGGPERETAMSEHETNGGPERESAMSEHETNDGSEREIPEEPMHDLIGMAARDLIPFSPQDDLINEFINDLEQNNELYNILNGNEPLDLEAEGFFGF